MIEKAIDIEVKANLQSPFKIKKIDFKYLKSHKPTKKDVSNQDNQDKDKAKSNYNSFFANSNQA